MENNKTVKQQILDTLETPQPRPALMAKVQALTGAKSPTIRGKLSGLCRSGQVLSYPDETGVIWYTLAVREVEYPQVEEEDDPNLTDTEIDDLIETYAQQQPILRKQEGIWRDVHVSVPETGYFALVFYSDWHIGSKHTQLLTIRREAQIIHDTDNMYCIFIGDAIDGGFPKAPHGGILNEQIMTPQIQREVASRIARLIGGKMLVAAAGCHEWWMLDAADYDFIKEAVKEVGRCKYLGGGGKFNLHCTGGSEWCGFVQHKPRGHSIYNDLHPCVVEAQRYVQDAEIIVVAHEHIIAIGKQMIGGKMRYMARSSGRKTFDRLASKLGTQGKRYEGMDMPVLIVHGTRKEAQWVTGIPTAAAFLGALRQADVAKAA